MMNLDSPRILLLLALMAASFGCYLLIEPYLFPILTAIVFGLLLHPVHLRVTKKIADWPNIAAGTTCGLLVVSLICPIIALMVMVAMEAVDFAYVTESWLHEGGLQKLLTQSGAFDWPIVKEALAVVGSDDFRARITDSLAGFGKGFMALGTSVLGDLTASIVNLSLLLFVFYFVIRDHDLMIKRMRHILPLSRSQEDALFVEIVEVAKSALLGSFMTALSQGIAGGFILWLAGLKGFFWGAIMAFASLIPVVGTALIWVPSVIYLWVTGDTGWAIGVAVWCIVVVGGIDNFLRPLFMQGASTMNTVLVFFALLGGLHVFGFAGLLFGPLVFGITMVLFRLYESEFAAFLSSQDHR